MKYSSIPNVFASIFTAVQISAEGLENIFSIICLCLTCLSVLISLVLKVIEWYNKAKEDGKISADEIRELNEDIKNSTDEIKDVIKK